MGFHGFSEVVITSNLGGPVGVVCGLGEVSGGYNLQNLAWTFADACDGRIQWVTLIPVIQICQQ